MERRVYSPEQKAATAEARLTAALEQLTNEQRFKAWLTLASRFHTYSPTNTALIFAQDPEASLLKGYRQWQALGRHVQFGAKAIEIFAPIWPKGTTKDQQKQQEPTAFLPVNVFDVRFTTGDPLPEPPHVPVLEGEQGKREYQQMTLGALGKDILVLEGDESDFHDAAMGYYRPMDRAILVRNTLDGKPVSQLQKLKTLAHEFAHGLNEHGHEGVHASAEVMETVAEGSAFIALSHFGIDSSERSFPYIACWTKDTRTLRQVMGTIQRTARTIIEATEGADVHLTDALAEPVRTPQSVSRGPFQYSTYHAFYGYPSRGYGAPTLTPK